MNTSKMNPARDDEQDLRSFFQRTAPAGRPVDVDQLLAHRQTVSTWGDIDMRIIQRALYVSAAALCCVAVVTCLIVLGGDQSLAFGEVKAQVEMTQSVQYTVMPGKVSALDQIRSLEQYLAEIESGLKVERLPEGLPSRERLLEQQKDLRQRLMEYRAKIASGALPALKRVKILGKSRMRTENLGPVTTDINIVNLETGGSISIDREQKRCVVQKTQGYMDPDTGEITERPIKPDLTVDFYQMFRQVPDDAKAIEETKEVGGRELVGFHNTMPMGDYTRTATYWVDPGTKLPRQIEYELKNSTGEPTRHEILTDIVFDAEMDEALFSTTPPEGYTVREGGFVSFGKAPE